jgi:hypothetical protein
MLERHHPTDSTIPSPVSVPLPVGGGPLRRVLDWGLVAGSFGLILFSTVALRPPSPPAGEPAAKTAMAVRQLP